MGGARHRASAATRGTALALLLAAATPAGRAAAQQESPGTDSLRLELLQLQRQLDSLKSVVSGLRTHARGGASKPAARGGDDLAALRAAAASAAGITAEDTATETTANTVFSSHQRSLQAMNPEISITGDLFAQVDSRTPGRDNFFPREFELSLVSSLDPYSRAKVFIAYDQPGGELVPFPGTSPPPDTGGSIDVEEGYADWVGLPGNVSITVGKFRQRFGTLNRWHSHALFFQDLPLPLQVFAGREGIAQTGASVYWLLPIHGAGTYELWLEPTVSSDEVLYGSATKLSALAHFNAFWDLSPSTYFEIGTSVITGRHEGDTGDFRRTLWGAESTLDWRPPARALYRELQLRGGVMVLSSGAGLAEPGARSRAVGAWSMFDYLFTQNWHLSGRFGWAQNPDDSTQSAWLAGPAVSWWQSEFVRIRGEYDVLGRPEDTPGKLLIQVTFAMGPHKHETY